jgi:lysozyme
MNSELIEHIIEFEGLELKPYQCTSNKTTIGVGRNLSDNGITYSEAMMLLQNDIDTVVAELKQRYEWFEELPPRAKLVLVDLGFNLGVPTLANFKKMLADIQDGLWESAAINLLDSRYAKQVGRRATYNASMLETAGTDHSLPTTPAI